MTNIAFYKGTDSPTTIEQKLPKGGIYFNTSSKTVTLNNDGSFIKGDIEYQDCLVGQDNTQYYIVGVEQADSPAQHTQLFSASHEDMYFSGTSLHVPSLECSTLRVDNIDIRPLNTDDYNLLTFQTLLPTKDNDESIHYIHSITNAKTYVGDYGYNFLISKVIPQSNASSVDQEWAEVGYMNESNLYVELEVSIFVPYTEAYLEQGQGETLVFSGVLSPNSFGKLYAFVPNDPMMDWARPSLQIQQISGILYLPGPCPGCY